MREKKYFCLLAAGDESARLERGFAKSLRQCSTCLTYRLPQNRPIVVLRYIPMTSPLTLVWDTDLTLLSNHLFLKVKAAVGNNWQQFLDVLPVQMSNGRDVGFSVLLCRYHVTVRGSTHVTFHVCPECGHRSYMGFGRRYLVEPINRSVPLFQSSPGILVIRGDALEALGTAPPEIIIEEVAIEQTPHDGLPANLELRWT